MLLGFEFDAAAAASLLLAVPGHGMCQAGLFLDAAVAASASLLDVGFDAAEAASAESLVVLAASLAVFAASTSIWLISKR